MNEGGDVIPPCKPARAVDETLREIGAMFPGWHVWYSSGSDTWNAHREDEKPYFGRPPVGSRKFMVSAYDAPGLVALLKHQDPAVTGPERPGCWIGRAAPGQTRPRSRNAESGTAAGTAVS
jgi:hypothetical protein